jgi:hypothetical protein
MPCSLGELRFRALRAAVVLGCFLWLARIHFFFGRYLERLPLRAPAAEAMREIGPAERVLTNSYLAVHLAERPIIEAPQAFVPGRLEQFDVLLVSERDPGDEAAPGAVASYLAEARRLDWTCRTLGGLSAPLVICRPPKERIAPWPS